MGFGRILAVDHGLVRIGLALSDPMGIVATPHSILDNENDDAEIGIICSLIKSECVIKVVIGLPTDSQGHIGAQAVKVIEWAKKLAARTSAPVVFWDESYSSARVEEMKHRRRARNGGKSAFIDDIAAAVILQEYLEAGGSENEPGQALQNFNETP